MKNNYLYIEEITATLNC